MRSLGSNPTPEEIEDMIDVARNSLQFFFVSDFDIKDADADGSGSVDFSEFVELMIKREAEKETPEDLKQAFRVFDKVSNKHRGANHALYISYQDGNGFVSTSEIKYVLTRFLNSQLEASIDPCVPQDRPGVH